jgi:hypothetical protein
VTRLPPHILVPSAAGGTTGVVHDFEAELTDLQVRWRRAHVSTQESGVQNRVTYPWLLPRWAWQEGLWPPLRGDGPGSLEHHLTTAKVSRHSGCHNLKSSWISGVNLYLPFGQGETGRALLAGFLAHSVDPRVRSVDSLELEWSGDREFSPRTLLGEMGGTRGRGQTSPDIAFSVNRAEGLLLVENKLVEHSFYACSARLGSGSVTRPGHPDPARCDDVAALVADPGICHQQALGRQYWRWLYDAVDARAFARLPRCPAATAGYQLLRQQALAEALARSGRYRFVASVVALDERNERLSRSLASSGIADVTGWGQLFRGRASFALFTHQRWAAWVRTHDADGAWRGWSDWIAHRYGI